MIDNKFKSGFVALLGRPNVGKSTFLNKILDYKVSIVSERVQTTRNKVTGIYTSDHGQIVFLDTPGMHAPKNKLGEHMVGVALQVLDEVDTILYVVEAENKIGPGDMHILEILKEVKTPVILGINKIDRVSREELVNCIHKWDNVHDFLHIVPLSAVSGDNTDKVLELIMDVLPYGPQYYPDDMITDQPERQIIAENIREKAIRFTHEEIPHSIAVSIDRVQESEGLIEAFATIIIERESQKGIIIGKKGSMIGKIMRVSQRDLEELLGKKVVLDVRVKVKKNWRKKEKILRDLGYV